MADLSTPEGKLVERLRGQKQPSHCGNFVEVHAGLLTEAADALSRIAAEGDEARERSITNWKNMQRLWDLAQGWDPDDNEEGPRCRDCADEDGRCPRSGYPCDPQEEAEERIGKLFARASAAERERDELKAALSKVVADYDACSGAEPSLSVLHMSIDIDARAALNGGRDSGDNGDKP